MKFIYGDVCSCILLIFHIVKYVVQFIDPFYYCTFRLCLVFGYWKMMHGTFIYMWHPQIRIFLGYISSNGTSASRLAGRGWVFLFSHQPWSATPLTIIVLAFSWWLMRLNCSTSGRHMFNTFFFGSCAVSVWLFFPFLYWVHVLYIFVFLTIIYKNYLIIFIYLFNVLHWFFLFFASRVTLCMPYRNQDLASSPVPFCRCFLLLCVPYLWIPQIPKFS